MNKSKITHTAVHTNGGDDSEALVMIMMMVMMMVDAVVAAVAQVTELIRCFHSEMVLFNASGEVVMRSLVLFSWLG